MNEATTSRSSGFRKWFVVLAVVISCAYVGGLLIDNQQSVGDVKVHRPVTEADRHREGEDWPIFLGPQETGVSSEKGLLAEWPESGPPMIWERTVGTGYSAPSVRGEKLVLHHRVGKKELIECFRADDGSEIWSYSSPTTYEDPYGYNNGPRCTPILTENRCYAFGAQGRLTCLELETGKRIWERELAADFELPEWFFGIGCTPVIEDNLLIVLVGGQPDSGVVAFELETGKAVWQATGKETWDGAKTDWSDKPEYQWTGEEMVVSYSSPIVAEIHGKRHVLCLLRHGLVSLDPRTGEENFKYWFRPRVHESVNAARPVVVGDKIFLSAAYRLGSVLLQVEEDGKSVSEVWKDPRNMLTHWSTAIHVDGFIYGFSGRHEREGELRCLDMKTGDVVWASDGSEPVQSTVGYDALSGRYIIKATGAEAPHPFFGRGSKIRVGNQFIVLGERGTLSLVNINSQKLEEVSRTSYKQIHYPAWTAPVLSRKRLYLRCEDALICLDLAPDDAESESQN